LPTNDFFANAMNPTSRHATAILPDDVSAKHDDALPKGARLQNDAFEIHAILGRGGQGITYRGMDVSLQRTVAIKEFFPPGSVRQKALVASPMADAEFTAAREKFGQQARLLARFNHESIVRIFRVFEENDTAYMVMEFLEGQTLAQQLKLGAPPMGEAVTIAQRIAAALCIVHDAQLLHRAVAPDNIFLTRDKRAVLIDFVAAREIANATQSTGAIAVPTSHGYAPIEQYSARSRLGAFTDVYGLGATLYHMLCGRAPVAAPDRLTGTDLPSPEKINGRVSPSLARVVMDALQIQPQDRTQTAREFADALKTTPASSFSFASSDAPFPRTPPAPRCDPFPRTPPAPPRGAATVALPDSNAPSNVSGHAAETGSTPGATSAAPMPRGALPIVPSSTPIPAPGTQFCPHCQSPMPAVMTRCPHCRQLKNKAPGDAESGTFREWYRNENTRIGLGWALAIGFILLLCFALAGGLSSLGLGPQRIQRNSYFELQFELQKFLP
jgi:serine/threonine-protein kinase